MTYNLRFLFIILFITSFSFVSLAQQTTSLSGSFKNTGKKQIYIFGIFGIHPYKLDSAKISKEGNFAFNFKKPLSLGYYLIGVGSQNNEAIIFVAGEKKLTLKADYSDLKIYEFVGSAENAFLLSANKSMESDMGQAQQIQTQIEATSNESQKDSLRGLMAGIDKIRRVRLEKMSSASKNLWISRQYSNQLATLPNKMPNPFYFNDLSMVRTFSLIRKVSDYISGQNRLQNIDSVVILSHNLLKMPGMQPLMQEAVYQSLIVIFASVNVEAGPTNAVMFWNLYNKSYATSPNRKYILPYVPEAAPVVGQMAPPISFPSPDGKILSLSDLKGKMVLIDFWASWCGPCRQENPNLVRTYHKYKAKGFTVFSVSLDNKKEAWAKAIGADSLSWPDHVSDLKGWSSAPAATYKVRGIPAAFLVGPDGRILAISGLRGEELDKTLEGFFKKR